MSNPLRIALVAEGPTDAVVIEATLRAMLGERSFLLKQVFPEDSSAFGAMGTGWVGVYKWCHAAATRGNGSLSGDRLISGPETSTYCSFIWIAMLQAITIRMVHWCGCRPTECCPVPRLVLRLKTQRMNCVKCC